MGRLRAQRKGLLLLDSAYEAFITSPDVPATIFEIPGAKECAIEFRSFSKSRASPACAAPIRSSPKASKRNRQKIARCIPPWNRRQAIKFNGVAYPIQKGAEAVYSEEGQKQTRAQVSLYLAQAKRLKEGLAGLGFTCYGGIDSPYLWVQTPERKTSWEFFDHLLKRCHLICIPGRGFGAHGEGFVRFSAFTTPEKTTLALERLHK